MGFVKTQKRNKIRLFNNELFNSKVGNVVKIKFPPPLFDDMSFQVFNSIQNPFRYKANVFSSKREKTYEMLLQDMHDKYWSHGSLDYSEGGRATSGSIKLYGHQRKAQEQIVSLSSYLYFYDFYDIINPYYRIHSSKWVKHYV